MVTCIFFFINSTIKIFCLRIGIITFTTGRSDGSTGLSDSQVPSVFTTVHVLKSVNLNEYKAFTSFDSNSQTALVDNCANTHIWNERPQFKKFREIPKTSHGVSTIGGQPNVALGIGDIPTSWRDDDGKTFYHTLKNVLFFPDSPVKIISPSKLAKEWGPTIDAEGTSITSKYFYSYFVWKYGKFSRTIQHPEHCLPELPVNEGYSSFRTFCNYCVETSTDLRTQWSSYYSVHTNVSNDSFSTSTFNEGEILRYSRDGFTCECKVISKSADSAGEVKYMIKLAGGRVFETMKPFLQCLDDVDIACIPEKEHDYAREIPTLSKEDLNYLAHPTALSKDDQDWLYHHNRLNHLGRAEMHKLAVTGVLPKNLCKYNLKSPFCASCAFGKAHRRQWRNKGSGDKHIRSARDNKPGAKVSVD